MPDTPGGAAALPDLRPRGIGELLDLSFRIYRRNFRLFAKFGVATGFGIAACSITGQWLVAAAMRDGSAFGANPLALAGAVFFGYCVLYAGLIVLYCLAFLFACYAVEDDLLGRRPEFRDLLRRAGGRLVSSVWTTFL